MKSPASPLFRIENGQLQSAIHEFERPETGSTISLVGMSHIAEPEYFDSVIAFGADRAQAGAAVHYESVKKPTDEELVTDKRARRAEQLGESITQIQRTMAKSAGLVTQADVLKYPETWENHDIHLTELVDSLNPASIRKFIYLARVAKFAGALPLPKKVIRSYFNQSVRQEVQDLGDNPDVSIKDGEILLETRNQVALTAAAKELAAQPDRDLVMNWGAFHLPGLGEGITSMGYTQKPTEHWLTVHSV